MSDHLIKGNFVSIPLKTRNLKQWRQFTPATREVYITMLTKYRRTGKGADGRVKWKQDELTALTGFGKSTIIRAVVDLKERSWICVWEPGGRWLDGTTYEMNPIYADG